MQAKFNSLECKVGCYKWGSFRCLVCENLQETNTISSTIAEKSFKVSHYLSCSDKCLRL